MRKLNNTVHTRIIAMIFIAILQLSPLQVSATPSAGDTEQVERLRSLLGLMQDFMNVIDAVHDMAKNPEKAAIHQMHEIEEIQKKRKQPELAIKLFRSILEKTDNQTIRNAAYMRIGDLLKKTGNPEMAVQTYEKALMENIGKMR
jgi:tetratricopeptide (TPR) repeat protein